MRGDRQVLARAAASALLAAACEGMGTWWLGRENRFAAASTKAQAREASEPLLAVCADCPIVGDCETWAALDRYTGIAAGSAWADGLPRSAMVPPGTRLRRRAS